MLLPLDQQNGTGRSQGLVKHSVFHKLSGHAIEQARESLNIVIYTVVIVIVIVDATIGLSPPRNYPTPRVQSATAWTASVHTLNAQTCDNVCAQSATGRTASVHTLHMLKPVITFLFKVLRHGLLRYI